MKVYLVIERWFFESNGTDYAMPLQTSDIKVCTSFRNALTMFSERRAWAIERWNGESSIIDVTDIKYINSHRSFQVRFKPNTRKIVTLESMNTF